MPIKGLKGGIGSKALGYGLGATDAETTDPEFNQTVLLLHGDGSEGAGDTAALGDPNYKAFKDNSTSAHAITVQGDTYGNDFSPYYYADGYWSNSFDASSDYLEASASSDFEFSGDFTIEAWVYRNNTSRHTVVSQWVASGSARNRLEFDRTAGKVTFTIGSTNNEYNYTHSANEWFHIAVVRNGSTITIYENGASLGSFTDSSTIGTSLPFTIGRLTTGGTEFDGYLSNVRVVNGTAVYTSSFTPSTSPLTAVTNTKLLTCQSNRFIDNSTSSHALTIGGDPKVSTNTPFTVTKTANVGSGFFQRTTDYLTSSNTATNFGTNDFTMECWVYYTALPPSNSSHSYIYGMNSGSHEVLWYLYYNSTSGQYQYTFRDPDVSSLVRTLITPTTHEWIHLAVVRSGTTITLFQNGQALTPSQVGDAGSHSYTCDEISVGGTSSLNGSFDGYIADVRVINGTALYTSNFTPPTSSLTAVADTTFLTCQYSGAVRNVGFLDDSKYNHQITRGGNVSMGTFSPFSLEDGYWSVRFNGSSALRIPAASMAFGTGDYTVQAWIYMTALPSVDAIIYDARTGSGGLDHYLFVNSSGYLRYRQGFGSAATGTIAISLNEWTHVAVTRESGTVKSYVNGTLDSTHTGSTANLTKGNDIEIGYSTNDSNYGFEGYISNFRINIGTAETISVSTSPLTDSSHSFLGLQSNRFIDNSTNDRSITIATGTPNIQPFSPFAPTRSYSKDAVGGSAYFDGSGDGLNAGTSAVFLPVANADFTFEAWVYLTATPGAQSALIMGISEYGTSSDWIMSVGSDLIPELYLQASGAGTVYQGSTAIKLNEWNHIAWSRSGTGSNNMKSFINGVEASSHTYTGTTDATGTTGLSLGSDGAFDEQLLTGYISNPRIINGTGLYTSAFTPPTAPFLDSDSNYDNTTFLARFDNAGIIDHTMKNNLETVGNVRISGQQTKFGTGSIYFDGSGDRMLLKKAKNLKLETGDFTFEFWTYWTGSGDQRIFFDSRNSTASTTGFIIRLSSSPNYYLSFYTGGAGRIEDNTTFPSNQWVHVALIRESGSTKLYKDGTQVGTTYSDSNDYSYTDSMIIGDSFVLTRPFSGYIDELRITKGVARYTGSSFTVPTKAFANR